MGDLVGIGIIAVAAAAIGIGLGIVIARRVQPLVDRPDRDDGDSGRDKVDD